MSIKDTGAGLNPEHLAQLFQAFNRLGQEDGGEEGTGIGLVVAKQLVELMEGVIGVESTVGAGSVFWFELNSVAEPRHFPGKSRRYGFAPAACASRSAGAHPALCGGQPGEPGPDRAASSRATPTFACLRR